MKRILFSASVILLALLLSITVFAFEAKLWPGDGDITETDLVFSSNSSGLDFRNGKLYSVDNGEGSLYIMDVAKDGTITFVPGFESGVGITSNNMSVPDAEGVSTDNKGFVYIAAERDNAGGNSCNMILKVNPEKALDKDSLLWADTDWNLTSAMPSVSSNKGIEACEWVGFEDINGKVPDKNTGKLFDSNDYPDSDSEGIMFVGLENNGHIYGFVLNSNGTSVLICDIESGFDGIMALDYDEYEDVLWAVTDNNFDNTAAKLTFNGTNTPEKEFYAAPGELDTGANNEGFAIADHTYTREGRRPVYRITDGPRKGALKVGSIYCDYVVHECLAFEWITIKEASCANGIEEKRCIECGKVAETNIVPSLYGHNNNSQVVYGTRINDKGQKELYCKECDIGIDIDASNISLVFEDTPLNTWYGDAVGFIYSQGYMGSTSAQKYTFEPNTNTSRAMFVTILGRIKGIDTEKYTVSDDKALPFSDMANGQWYTPCVIWAYETGVVTGYPNGCFGINDSITREQIVSILYRISAPSQKPDDKILGAYTDASSISSYAVDAFKWAVENRIVKGTSATTLAPKKTATRAEIAQVVLNYLDSGF